MKKRLISLIVAVVMLFSMLCPAAYADDETVSFDTCTHEWETPLRSGYSITIPGSDVSFSVKTEQCKKCKWYKHVATIFIAEFTYYSPLNVDANGLVPTELATYWANVWYNNFGKNATATKFTPGGGLTDGSGVGRNPKGYGDEGKANVNSNGKEILWVEPFGITGSYNGFSKFAPNGLIAGSSGSGTSFLPDSSSKGDYASPTYYFIAPVSGLYYVGSSGNPYDFGSFNSFQSDKWIRTDYTVNYKDSYQYSISLNKGEACYFFVSWKVDNCFFRPYKFFLNNAPIFVEPLGDSGVKNYSKITINNNTWNGNIYVDNSNNLTYIYPQYTTINEKNETVTNISNTPIIYNNETYQYYTYDQTTKNYYYITYPNQPTPPPTATPSPSPAPTETPSPSPSPAPVEPILPANRFRIIPNMTGNNFTDSHGTWSAFGSSEYSSLYTYFRAFTADSSYWWTSSQSKKSGSYDREMPCWLAIEIPDPENYYIDGYVLKGAGSGIYFDDWQFQYSDDGSTWTDLDSVSDGGLKDQKEHDFNVAVHKAHKYYRWYFTKAPVSWPGLGTANLYGYNAKDVVTPTPSPSPAPDPGKPGGDTTGILALLVEIRDNMIQGFLDIKAAFVAGFAELSANFTLAIENLTLNIQNVFNKKFPDQSTPETALPSPTPSPSPAPTDPPSPSPAPDPGKPDSGDKTNNFWTIIFPHGGGTEDGKKGIFWALVSLILALIAFFANLAVGVGYLFPFLPDGVVMTINTCLIVIFLFTIIKFIMRSK